MYYVVGSGPAGISAAMALLARGLEVTMLDAGYELEPERTAVVGRLRTMDKKEWDAGSISVLKENANAHLGGVDLKHIYGSDFPFRGMDSIQPVTMSGARMVRSLARGGLSNVWGGSILPNRSEDITDWPVTLADLEPHYRAVLAFMSHAGQEDELSRLLPLYDSAYDSFLLSCQAAALLKDLRRNSSQLEAEGFFFGHARLAVRFGKGPDTGGCQYCGMCLYGCPGGNIYSTAHSLEKLLLHDKFKYVSGVLVEKIVDGREDVKIEARLLPDLTRHEFTGQKVLLGAGILSST